MRFSILGRRRHVQAACMIRANQVYCAIKLDRSTRGRVVLTFRNPGTSTGPAARGLPPAEHGMMMLPLPCRRPVRTKASIPMGSSLFPCDDR